MDLLNAALESCSKNSAILVHCIRHEGMIPMPRFENRIHAIANPIDLYTYRHQQPLDFHALFLHQLSVEERQQFERTMEQLLSLLQSLVSSNTPVVLTAQQFAPAFSLQYLSFSPILLFNHLVRMGVLIPSDRIGFYALNINFATLFQQSTVSTPINMDPVASTVHATKSYDRDRTAQLNMTCKERRQPNMEALKDRRFRGKKAEYESKLASFLQSVSSVHRQNSRIDHNDSKPTDDSVAHNYCEILKDSWPALFPHTAIPEVTHVTEKSARFIGIQGMNPKYRGLTVINGQTYYSKGRFENSKHAQNDVARFLLEIFDIARKPLNNSAPSPRIKRPHALSMGANKRVKLNMATQLLHEYFQKARLAQPQYEFETNSITNYVKAKLKLYNEEFVSIDEHAKRADAKDDVSLVVLRRLTKADTLDDEEGELFEVSLSFTINDLM